MVRYQSLDLRDPVHPPRHKNRRAKISRRKLQAKGAAYLGLKTPFFLCRARIQGRFTQKLFNPSRATNADDADPLHAW